MLVEHGMYFFLGALIGATIMLLFAPLVHNRAVRLTKRRLQGLIPLDVAEIKVEKDLQRAEFAMSMRRLEVVVGDLKAKHAAQLVEVGKKADAVNQMKRELGDKKAAIVALEDRARDLLGRVRSAKGELLDLRSLSSTQLGHAFAEKKLQHRSTRF
jgi:hypothetical protein